MRRIPVVQIGVGGVGRALVEQVLHFNEYIGPRLGCRFSYIALADRQGAIVADERIPLAVLLQAIAAKRAGQSLSDVPDGGPLNDWRNLLTPLACLVVDVSAQDGAETDLVAAVQQGHRVVLANKKPLCGSMDSFRSLTQQGRTRYEATVGAGLPVISTLQMLLDTGDRIEGIAGCFSGTLGYLTTQLEAGVAFSEAVQEAMHRGWTEPDPRDDLSGMDVARKALILARTSGLTANLNDFSVEHWYPEALASISRAEFLEQLPSLNEGFQSRFTVANEQDMALRYVARISMAGAGSIQVGFEQMPRAEQQYAPFSSLQGTDNLVLFQTQRYNVSSLSIRGPGAGVDVTASAVLHDMVAFAREWD